MAEVRPMPAALPEYVENNEDAFRRAVQDSLNGIVAELNGTRTVVDPETSLAVKRSTFLPPFGVQSYG